MTSETGTLRSFEEILGLCDMDADTAWDLMLRTDARNDEDGCNITARMLSLAGKQVTITGMQMVSGRPAYFIAELPGNLFAKELFV